MSIGLLVSGSIVCTAGVALTVLPVKAATTIAIFGVTSKQAAAIGALAYNAVAMFGAPCLGIVMETIEFS